MTTSLSPRLRTLGILLVVAAAILGLDRIGAFRWAGDMVVEARMSLAPRKAGGGIVFLGIDNRSLEAVGVWPWPREIYGEIAQRLEALGAAEVFFDIDLSAPSDPASDERLAGALAELEVAVILAAFQQPGGLGAAGETMRDNLPLPMFRDHAWLASVNVTTDRDGRVRRYPYGQVIAGEEVLSAASLLSGVSGPAGSSFAVNFAVTPSSVPSHAVIDLLEGAIDPAMIDGRSVVVGAHAIELRDDLPVPVHGIIPGALLQILAAETLLQGIAPVPLHDLPLFLAVLGLAIAAGLSPLRHRPVWLFATFATAATSIEAAAFVLQARHAIVVPTPILHATLAASGLVLAGSELDLRRWLLRLARVDHSNADSVLKRIITDSSDAIVVVDEGGAVIQMSARACDLFGVPGDAAGPITMDAILPAGLAAATREAMAAFGSDAAPPEGRRALAFPVDGRMRHVEYTITPSRLQRLRQRGAEAEDIVLGCVTARDVTLAHEQRQRLDHLTRFDVLTGAMNRSELARRLAALPQAPPDAGRTAAFALNLHRFRSVNGALGRDVGDALLRAVVERLGALERPHSGVARLGADTFALVCHDIDPAEAEALADALNARVAEPFVLDAVSVRVESRVGIAFGGEAGDGAQLLERAEAALDEARLQGCGHRVFDPASSARQARARQVERALWSAIENDELALAYQPQVDLRDLRFTGAEALVRWVHPVMGRLAPDEFIGIAEASGFIGHLGRWVLERACRDATAWPEHMAVAVNVSPLQFQRSDVVADVQHALAASGLAPTRLHLEITETIFVAGSTELSWTLDALRDLGTSLALDDFGSGFSSFGYLAKLPLDKLKLDKQFVQALEGDPSNAAIVRSVVMLARELGLTLVCEGVETEVQRDFLRHAGCDQGQGYFFGKPQGQSEILSLFAAAAQEPVVKSPAGRMQPFAQAG